MLTRALDDARKGGADARGWIESDESGEAAGFQFVDVCQVLGIDPSWARAQVTQGARPPWRRTVTLGTLRAA